MPRYIVTDYPVGVSALSGTRTLELTPGVLVQKWFPLVGMAVIEVTSEGAAVLTSRGYRLFEDRLLPLDLCSVYCSDVVAGDRLYSWQVNRLLGVDAFHELGITGSGVKIADIDSGVMESHVALQGKIIEERVFGTGEQLPDWHGTAVASLIVGEAEPSQLQFASGGSVPYGIRGVAYGAGLGSFVVRTTEDIQTSQWVIIEAMDKAAELGYRIMNLSLGLGPWWEGFEKPWYDVPVSQAAQRLAEQGFLIIAAVGNAGLEAEPLKIMHPAQAPGVVGVGMIDPILAHGGVDPDSSRGPANDGSIKPDVCGVSNSNWTSMPLVVASDEGMNIAGFFAGTSGSTPQVAGFAALLYQAYGGITPADFLNHMSYRAISPTEPYVKTNGSGWGLINAGYDLATYLRGSVPWTTPPATGTLWARVTNLGGDEVNLKAEARMKVNREPKVFGSVDIPLLPAGGAIDVPIPVSLAIKGIYEIHESSITRDSETMVEILEPGGFFLVI